MSARDDDAVVYGISNIRNELRYEQKLNEKSQ